MEEVAISTWSRRRRRERDTNGNDGGRRRNENILERFVIKLLLLEANIQYGVQYGIHEKHEWGRSQTYCHSLSLSNCTVHTTLRCDASFLRKGLRWNMLIGWNPRSPAAPCSWGTRCSLFQEMSRRFNMSWSSFVFCDGALSTSWYYFVGLAIQYFCIQYWILLSSPLNEFCPCNHSIINSKSVLAI